MYSQANINELIEQIRSAQATFEEAASVLARVDTSGEAGGNLFVSGGGCALSGLAGFNRVPGSSVSSLVNIYRAASAAYASKAASISAAVGRVSANFENTENSLQRNEVNTVTGIADAPILWGTAKSHAQARENWQAFLQQTAKKHAITRYDSATMSGEFNMDMCECMLDFSQLAYDLFSSDEALRQRSEKMLREMGFDPANVVICDYPECIICSRTNEDGTPTVVVAFRGSSDVDDWMENFMAYTTPDDIHTGFETRVQGLMKKMDQIKLTGIEGSPSMAEFFASVKSGEKANILLTGHSLGGAEAQLLNYHLLDQGVPAESVTTYTFASPHPFESVLSEAISNPLNPRNTLNPLNLFFDLFTQPNHEAMNNANCYNIINPADPVPKVGADIIAGSNIGTDMYIDLSGQQRQSDMFAEHTGGAGEQLNPYRQYIQKGGLHNYTNGGGNTGVRARGGGR